jgi:integrase
LPGYTSPDVVLGWGDMRRAFPIVSRTTRCMRVCGEEKLRKDALYPILNRLGIPQKKGASGFHTFTHSAASIVNEQTENLKLAQKFLGHSIIKMTADIYTHNSQFGESGTRRRNRSRTAIYGDLFPVVPNIENRNNFAVLN